MAILLNDYIVTQKFTREQREKNIIKSSMRNNGLEKQNFCFIEKW